MSTQSGFEVIKKTNEKKDNNFFSWKILECHFFGNIPNFRAQSHNDIKVN